jgi:membrane protein implicated in regulation of membrane protease activity
MPAWLAWVIVAAVLGGVEMLSLTLVAGLLAVAAVAAAATAALGAGGAGQAGAFAITSGLSIAILLPALRRRVTSRPRSGVAALVGQSAQVLELVDAQHGRVRIGGEVWSARAYVPEQVIPVGAVVDVFEIRGATALVHAEETTT